MALRLAGEEFSVLQGLDAQGWVREITVSDALPALILDQAGSGPILSLRNGGVVRLLQQADGKVLLSNGTAPPSAPDSLVHLWRGSAGVVSARTEAVLTLEDDADVELQLLAPNNRSVGVSFGDADNPIAGMIQYQHSNDRFSFHVKNAERVRLTDVSLDFLQATTISTAAGDLELNPAGNVKFGSHSAVGAETVTGYITIKDGGGTLRKLAVIS
jgi:hypothetical protein